MERRLRLNQSMVNSIQLEGWRVAAGFFVQYFVVTDFFQYEMNQLETAASVRRKQTL